MKLICLFSLQLIFLINYSFAQTEWITEIPVFGDACSMLRTKDSCYAVLKCPIYYNADSTNYFYDLQLSKVTPQGELLWYDTVFSDTLDFVDLSFIQLSNEDYFITGQCWCCPFYCIVSKEGELKYFDRLENYMGTYSSFFSPIEISDTEVWVLGGYSQMYITKINLTNHEVSVDSSALCIHNASWPLMESLSDNRILVASNYLTNIYIIDIAQNVINQTSLNSRFFNPRYKPFHINPYDSLYYFYVQTLDPYPNQRYGFMVLNSQLDSIKFIDNTEFYPNQSQVEYPRILDFDFPKPGNITMTGYIYWYPGYSEELPYIHSYNYIEDTDEYFHAYVGSVTRYSINMLKDGNGYVMLHAFQGNPGFVFLVKENTDTLTNRVPDLEYDTAVKIYPNPAGAYITIESNKTTFSEIIILNAVGNTISDITFGETRQKEISVEKLAPGRYFIKIRNNKNQTHITSFVKS